MILLDRDDLISGLRELVAEIHAAGSPVGLRIVGGGAIVLRHFDRRLTVDIDAVQRCSIEHGRRTVRGRAHFVRDLSVSKHQLFNKKEFIGPRAANGLLPCQPRADSLKRKLIQPFRPGLLHYGRVTALSTISYCSCLP